MCYVNFVKESNAFMEYARNEMLTANERLLWYALFHIMNKRAKGGDWPEGFVSVTNRELLSFCPFGEDSLASARNKLCQRGLIEYVRGEKNKKAPQYKMNYFCPELSTGFPQGMESYPKISGNNRGNMGGNTEGNSGGNRQGNMGGIYINNNYNSKPIPFSEEEKDDEDEVWAQKERRLNACKGEVAEKFTAHIGRRCTPAEAEAIARVAIGTGLDGVIDELIRTAGQAGAANVCEYIRTVARDWKREAVRTSDDVAEYEFDRDARAGKLTDAGIYPGETANMALIDHAEARRRRYAEA